MYNPNGTSGLKSYLTPSYGWFIAQLEQISNTVRDGLHNEGWIVTPTSYGWFIAQLEQISSTVRDGLHNEGWMVTPTGRLGTHHTSGFVVVSYIDTLVDIIVSN